MSAVIAPEGGPVQGGTIVLMNWTIPADTFISLTFDGNNATDVQYFAEAQALQARVPAGIAGTVPVVFQNSNGEEIFTYNLAYTYYSVIPIVLNPSSGSVEGGYEVIITGPGIGLPDFTIGVGFGVLGVVHTVIDFNTISVIAPDYTEFGGPGPVQVVLIYGEPYENSSATFTYVIPCLAPSTRVLLSNGMYKEIQDIKRGEYVAGDLERRTHFRVSRVNILHCGDNTKTDMVEFAPHSLGHRVPMRKLTMTGFHPVVYNGARREAKCFRQLDGVKCHNDARVVDVMGRNRQGQVAVYDLQFDVDGHYVAEHVVVQSRSPNYIHTPLPRELYFDQSLYSDARVHSALNHPLPLDHSLV